MEQYQCIVVDLSYYDNEKILSIKVTEGNEFRISVEVDGVDISVSGEYYFETFQKFRDLLLTYGYGLKCNGSRTNAIQSAMMGNTQKIYLVELGKQALMKDVADIWDYADIDVYPNTKAQVEYARKWYDSIDK